MKEGRFPKRPFHSAVRKAPMLAEMNAQAGYASNFPAAE
jgi:hypothetical protein